MTEPTIKELSDQVKALRLAQVMIVQTLEQTGISLSAVLAKIARLHQNDHPGEVADFLVKHFEEIESVQRSL